MATEETEVDFNWRDATNTSISPKPWPLENETGVKCYRNVILLWLFHTPLLLNWIEDNHGLQHDSTCPLCTILELASRFWSKERRDADKELIEKFNEDVDDFWKATHIPELIEDLNRQNDAEEYMKSLLYVINDLGYGQWTELIQVQKQCVKRCKECPYHTQDSEEDFEEDFLLQGTISHKHITYEPLCHTFQFSKYEKAACKNESCPSKKRKPKPSHDHRPGHEFFYGLRTAPPILVIHCKPYTYGGILSDGRWETFLSGKVTRLEHSLAFSIYPDRTLDPNSISWSFYHLYGVILRRGNTGSHGHYVCAFEQRQTGRWLLFNDCEYFGLDDTGQQIIRQTTTALSQRQLDKQVDEMQKADWGIFMLMYRRLFEVPVRLLTRNTFPSTAIALQDRISHEESGQPEKEDVQEEYFTPGERVENEDSLGSESISEQTEAETQRSADDKQLQGSSSDSKTRDTEQPISTEQPGVETLPESSIFNPDETHVAAEVELESVLSISDTRNGQEEQPMLIDPPTKQIVEVEADPKVCIPKSAAGQARYKTPEAAGNISRGYANDSESQTDQAEQPLPTELHVEIEADPGSSTARTGITATESRAQAEKNVQERTQIENENGQMASSHRASEVLRTEVEPSVQPKNKRAKGKAAKRSHDKALDAGEQKSVSVPAIKKARTGTKPSTQSKQKEPKPKAEKRSQKVALDGQEDEKAEESAPASKKAKSVIEPSTGYVGRETRSRARAKRFDHEIPDVDRVHNEQTATFKPATKEDKATRGSAKTSNAQTRRKTQRKK